MRVDDGVRRFLCVKAFEQHDEERVLENVSVISRVKSVPVAQHIISANRFP